MFIRPQKIVMALCAVIASNAMAQDAANEGPMCTRTDGFGKQIVLPCSELVTLENDEQSAGIETPDLAVSAPDQNTGKSANTMPGTSIAAGSETESMSNAGNIVGETRDMQLATSLSTPQQPTPATNQAANIDLETIIALIAGQVTEKVSADIDAKLDQLTLNKPPAYKATQEELTSQANARAQGYTTPVTGKPGGRVEMVYGQGIPTLICAPLQQCIIELEDGEVLSDVTALSETSRWDKFLRHRKEGTLKTIIGLKPHYDAEPAMLSFLTNRRLYVVRLVPSHFDNTYILSFSYPDTQERIEAERIAEMQAIKEARAAATRQKQKAVLAKTGVKTTTGAYVPARNREWASSIRGNAPFKPVRVSWDQKYTYIELPQNYRGDIPSVDIPAGQPAPVITVDPENGKRLILDQVIKSFKLSLGRKTVSVAP